MGGLRALGRAARPRSRRRRRRAVAPLRTVRLARPTGPRPTPSSRARRCGGAPSPACRAALADAIAADLAAMEPRMRRLLTFACEGAELAGSLDDGGGATGLLLVTGGSQTRIGSHRMYERLAKALGRQWLSLLSLRPARGRRQRRRGPGLPRQRARHRGRRGRVPAANAPASQRVIGFGLCDGATALALFGKAGRARRPDPGQSLAGRGRGRRAAARGDPRALSQAADQPRGLEENPFRRSGLAEAAQGLRKVSPRSRGARRSPARPPPRCARRGCAPG